MRVAAIDIGTNTVLLLIAEQTAGGALEAVEERATITRLGQGVDATRTLHPEAIARTNACLAEYAEAVRGQGVSRVAVVGTSAMRDAQGGAAVRAQVQAHFGVEARVISGDDEARLAFAGAVSGLAVRPGPRTVFDIGGGSTELVHGTVAGPGVPARIERAVSLDIGSVRLTERHVRSDPPSAAERDAIRADVMAALSGLPALPEVATAAAPIGIAGTVTTLAAVSLGLATYDSARVHGHTMPLRALRAVVARLAALPLAERSVVPGLEPKRADVIVAGGILAVTLLERLGADHLQVSDRGVRWGLAAELAAAEASEPGEPRWTRGR